MKGYKIKIDQLDDAFEELTEQYGFISEGIVSKAIEKAASDGVDKLRSSSPMRTGEYARSWDADWKKQKKGQYAKVIYARSPHYRLTHLLEKGHAKVNGGRVEPKVHIEPVERDTVNSLIEYIKEGLSE